MNPWKVYAGSIALMNVIYRHNLGRAGTLAFWLYVGTAMGAAQVLKPQYVGTAGIAMGSFVMMTHNYVHPFGRGPNPLK